MTSGDCALAEAVPLVTVSWTGWPHAAEPESWSWIEPYEGSPAEMGSCWQLAPDEVAWQVQWPPWWPLPLPESELPDGRPIAAVSWPVALLPVSVTWKTTWAAWPYPPP